MGEVSLDWLRENQLADGSWGSNAPYYCHERLVCTLAAMIALARKRYREDRERLERARAALETMPKNLHLDPAGETIGFEMLVPPMIEQAAQLGLVSGTVASQLEYLTTYRNNKLARLPRYVIDRTITVAFSAEMVGLDGLHLLDVPNLREANGSVAYSPAATSFFALHINRGDPAALGYLQAVTCAGAAPYIAPIEIFELAWCLWNLALVADLDAEILVLCQHALDLLEIEWQPGRGAAACAGLTLVESDTTSVVFKVLRQFGRPADIEAVLRYEEASHFRCFQLEANPSLSANIHVLDALKEEGLPPDHHAVRKVLSFLRQTRSMQMFWFDKWHISPYYPTVHAIIACMDYENDAVDDAIYWIRITQHPDGSWGYYMPTAEETALCLQALVMWKRRGGQVPDDVLKRGAGWLAEHINGPYPPLWIGKCLYCPELVVRSVILSALMLVESEVGNWS
ncbi:MAG: cyclase [Anaerolineae bacterium]|nr:cyclase [Anaerolineae bacterium]